MSEPPDPDRVAADEARMGALLRSVEAPAPAALQSRIAARNAPPRRRWQGAPAIALGLSGAATAACVALILLLTSGSSPTAPTVARAALVALTRPTAPAPGSLVAAGTSIAFPDWSSRGWPSAGTRSDHLAGRAITTEFYRSYESGRLGYAIVAGAPLAWGAAGSSTSIGGETYTRIRNGGALIVTWVQDGHTCILASRTAAPSQLLALAVSQDRAAPA